MTTEEKQEIDNYISTALPKYFVTYQELDTYLNNYLSKEEAAKLYIEDAELTTDTDGITMNDGDNLKLNYSSNKLSLEVTPQYVEPVITITATPDSVEYGDTAHSNITINVSVSDIAKIKSITVSGGNLSSETDITDTRVITDTIDNKKSQTYIFKYTNSNNQLFTKTFETTIIRKILYGASEITSSVLSSLDNMEEYDGTIIESDKNPSSITIDLSNNKYGWIATPYLINSIQDDKTGLFGGWYLACTWENTTHIYDTPYTGDTEYTKYYVYKTGVTGLGNATWNLN